VPVVLAEAGDHFGGKVATERFEGFTIEHGPDSFLTTRPAAVSLARELGLGDELVGTKDPRAVYIRHRGELVPMPDGLGLVLPTKALPFARTRLFSWPEKAHGADVVRPRCSTAGRGGARTCAPGPGGPPRRTAGRRVYGTPIDE
jgi:oxygen-dependent protoporphyrinogen oxidase